MKFRLLGTSNTPRPQVGVIIMAAAAMLVVSSAGFGRASDTSNGAGGGEQTSGSATGKGLNYATGNGMDQLNCDSRDRSLIASDMTLVAGTQSAWVRAESSMYAVSGLATPPGCDASALEADPYSGIRNVVAGISATGATPLVNVLAYHYDRSMRAAYLQWLDGLLAALPEARAFELGNEENLANSTEGWTHGGDSFPYGWSFNAADFAPDDSLGVCPQGAAAKDFAAAVSSYVSWLADSYHEIKSRRPDSTVVLGGLSSWQPQCFTQLLDRYGAESDFDAVAYHPYGPTPQQAVQTLEKVWPEFEKWNKPVWITEFGYSSAGGGSSSVASEEVKAKYLAETYALLSKRLSSAHLLGPIIYYTTRDEPLSAAQWASQCQYVTCQPSSGAGDPARIPGTALDVSGYGLFERLDDNVISEPAYTSFTRLR